jgi:Protein of unknown function (DUF1570)
MQPLRRRPARSLLPVAATLLLLPACNSFKSHVMAPPGGEAKADVAALPPLPAKYSFRVAPYVFVSDFELKRDLPLFQELTQLRDQVYKELQLPSGTTAVQVYLFEDREHYDRFMQAHYPDLPRRSAFFVAQSRTIGGSEDLLVYTYWGDRVQQNLRHELTHALLHSVLKDVPLWLDEGLAEFFELPPENQGVNAAHVEKLLHESHDLFKPDLARLESLSSVGQMNHVEYREAWAWTHLMLRGQPEAKTVLLTYLQQLRSNPNPGAFRPRLIAAVKSPEEAFAHHLETLEEAGLPRTTAQRM